MTAATTKLFLLALALSSSGLFGSAEDCGDTQHSVENGLIRLPDFSGESIRDLNCSWTYTAPPGRKLLVKVDSVHLPPLDLRTSQFQLYVDETFYDIPRNCVKCLREMVGGKVLRVVFTSYVAPVAEAQIMNSSEPLTEGMGSFQVRYKAFDPYRCSKPEQIENGFVINKGKKLGQSIFYGCNPPYDLIGDAELVCTTTTESPVPEWSGKTPKCIIQDCTGEPIAKQSSSGAIASPGYPSYIHHFFTPCLWEVTAQPNQQIKVSITYLKFPKRMGNSFSDNASRLSLLDGDSGNYIVNMTETLRNGSLNFTTLTNKLTVEFIVIDDSKKKEEIGFYMDYSAVSSSCPKPIAPENGEVIAYSNGLESVVAYRCLHGFVLVGELHVECLLNGQWSHPTPSCEPINVGMPPFLTASNDSDTVTAKLSELPLIPETAKHPKNGKKKATELMSVKDVHNISETQEKPSVPKDSRNVEHSISPIEPSMLPVKPSLSTVEPSVSPVESSVSPVEPSVSPGETSKPNGKKLDKDGENGPKSEPHLLQVVPPKINGKKSGDDQGMAIGKPSGNVTRAHEQIPSLGTGYKEEGGGFFQLTDTMIYIIAGVTGPLVLIVIIVVVVTVYRRRYPVRMRFGRKFSTFENPMYVTKDAQHPRELKRLTT